MDKTGSILTAIFLGALTLVVAVKSFDVQVTVPSDQSYGAVSSATFTETGRFGGGFNSVTRPFVSTTTVACMAQNPMNATTTFRVAWSVPTATTTTTVLAIATTTNANRFATSTAILSKTLAAVKGEASYVGANNQNLLGPGEWVQVGYGAGTTLPLVAQQQTGTCGFTFESIY